jgi:hypothetical protein
MNHDFSREVLRQGLLTKWECLHIYLMGIDSCGMTQGKSGINTYCGIYVLSVSSFSFNENKAIEAFL